MTRRSVAWLVLVPASIAAGCAATSPGRPEEQPPAPGPLEPEHRGEFVPRSNEQAPPRSLLVDGGGAPG